MKNPLLILSLLTLWSCGDNTKFLHHSSPVARTFFASTYNIHEIDTRNKIDILWVVDNSGSMMSIQQNIVKNAELFMKEFIKSNYIDWKMGLISTDKREDPYLGFDIPFNRATLDPVTLFKNSVSSLGIQGDSSEYVFHNIYRTLTLTGGTPFLRSDAHLAVIMVTDEDEQSDQIDPIRYEVNKFFDVMRSMINPRFKMRFYGAIAATELENCDAYAINYANSPYETMIKLTSGFVVSACKTDFGDGLSNIGKDIASLLEYPRLLLSERPRVNTIKVMYKGLELGPGRPETGGYWYYDDEFNMIVFYNLNFAQDFEADSVDVTFEINDGEIR